MTRSSLSGIGGALAAAIVFLCAPRAALGQEAPEDAEVEAPPEPGAGTPRPLAPDWRSGTLLLSVGGSYLAPLGSLAAGLAANERVAGGPGVTGSLGFGLSRHTSFQIQGTYGWLSGAEACPSCTASTVAVGMGLTYHLVQGIAFDPWASVGVGYRTMLLTVPETAGGEALAGGGRYHGIDFARVALGGDFSPHPVFGIGPYVEAAFGSYRLRPVVDSAPSIYAFVQVGLRIVLDPLRGGRITPQRVTARAY